MKKLSGISNKNNITALMIVYFIFHAGVLMAVISRPLDNDAWWLMNTGRYILQNGLPVTEPFTMHGDFAFVCQQWLSDVVLYSLYDAFGNGGIIALRLFTVGASGILFYKTCAVNSPNRIESTFLTALYTAFFTLFAVSRPQMFSCLIFAAELFILESFTLKGKRAVLAFLPLLSCLLANFHSALWLMFFVLALPYIVDFTGIDFRLFAGKKRPALPLLISLAASALSGLINPYGYKACLYIFRSFGISDINKNVAEMQPMRFDEIGAVYMALMAFVIAVHFLRKSTLPTRHALLTAGTALLALLTVRSSAIFVVASLFPLAGCFPVISENFTAFDSHRKNSAFSVLLAVVFCAIFAFSAVGLCRDIAAEPGGDESIRSLSQVVDELEKIGADADSRIFTTYNDGGYVEWRGYRAFMDARAEVFVKKLNRREDVLEEYVKFESGKIHYAGYFEKWDFDYLIMPASSPINTYIAHDKQYTVLFKNKDYVLYK